MRQSRGHWTVDGVDLLARVVGALVRRNSVCTIELRRSEYDGALRVNVEPSPAALAAGFGH
jgi:hypothetical protein